MANIPVYWHVVFQTDKNEKCKKNREMKKEPTRKVFLKLRVRNTQNQIMEAHVESKTKECCRREEVKWKKMRKANKRGGRRAAGKVD